MSSVYEKWISANHALFACYEAVPVEQYTAMPAAEQNNVCKSEQSAVAAFLKDDSINFKHLIQARLASFEQL